MSTQVAQSNCLAHCMASQDWLTSPHFWSSSQIDIFGQPDKYIAEYISIIENCEPAKGRVLPLEFWSRKPMYLCDMLRRMVLIADVYDVKPLLVSISSNSWSFIDSARAGNDICLVCWPMAAPNGLSTATIGPWSSRSGSRLHQDTFEATKWRLQATRGFGCAAGKASQPPPTRWASCWLGLEIKGWCGESPGYVSPQNPGILVTHENLYNILPCHWKFLHCEFWKLHYYFACAATE